MSKLGRSPNMYRESCHVGHRTIGGSGTSGGRRLGTVVAESQAPAMVEHGVVDAPGVLFDLATKPANAARTGKITASLRNGNKKVVTVTINP